MGDSRYDEAPLSAIADFRNGKGLFADLYASTGKYPVFGANGQIARTNELLNEDPVVVIGRVGAYCGSVHAAFEPSWVTDNAIVARPKPGADVRYLYYRLKSLDLRATATGSAQPLVTQGGLAGLRAHHAPLTEQRAIAHILGTLDDKIELNRRMNDTLEAMARALFKSWFVDFDPVRAKAEGRQPSGMDAETAKLFPSEFVESELGEIPKGWTLRAVGDLAILSGGKQLQRELIFEDGTIPVFGGAGIMGFTAGHNADRFVISVGRVGAYCGQFFSHRGKAWINNNASLIRPNNERFAEWLFIALTHANIDIIKKGAAQPFVSNGDIARLKVLWPGEEAIGAFSQQLVPLLNARDANDAESKTVARLRGELLPRLLSGELSACHDPRVAEPVP